MSASQPCSSVTPRYLAIVETLRTEILAASPNTVLPTENQLAVRFGVSRPTLRRALGLLERSGLILRQRARGTIVSPPKVVRSLQPLYTIEEDFRRKGIPLETCVLDYRPALDAPQHIRDILKLDRHGRVALLVLRRLVNGQIIACDFAYIPISLMAKVRPDEVTARPLIEVLGGRTGVPIDRLDWEIEILPSAPEVASVLKITPGVLVVASNTTAYALDGTPVSRNERYYRIDLVKFHFVTQFAERAVRAGSRRRRPTHGKPERPRGR